MPPSLSQITANFFVNLINRLGVRPPPPDAFLLSNVVNPVSIVDSDVVLTSATASQLLDTATSAGEQAAPVINTVLADTGALPAGNYLMQIMLSYNETVNAQKVAIQRRDAANATNIWEQRVYNSSAANGVGSFTLVLNLRVTLQVNERVRLIILVAGSGTSFYDANIWTLAS